MKSDCNELKSVHFKYRCLLLILALAIVLFDQVTKYAAREYLVLYQPRYVMEYFNWTLAYNSGAAFSLFDHYHSWPKFLFGALAIMVAVWIIHYLLNRCYNICFGTGLSLILGGAVGNLVDRIIFGRVTDFIDWHYGIHHWPAFNIADSAVTIGVTLLILNSLFCSTHDNEAKK